CGLRPFLSALRGSLRSNFLALLWPQPETGSANERPWRRFPTLALGNWRPTMPRMTRGIFVLSLLPLVACGGDAAPPSDNADTLATTTAEAGADTAGLQALIELPADFGPEGIEIGNGNAFFVGAMTPPNAGQIVRGDLSTGEYEQLVPARGVPALGIAYHAGSNRIFVAGGDSGGGAVFDAESGDEVATLDPGGSIINDVDVTDDAAYFTDSEEPALYLVALDVNGQQGEITTVELPANFG